MLPEITNFQEALTTLGHMNMLQAELQTLCKPLSDLERIICHCQKMSTNPQYSEQFVPIKLKYLQTTMTQIADLPPSFTATTIPREYQEPRTWSSYSSDVAIHARAHNSLTRTRTVLAATSKPGDRWSNQSDRRRSSSPGSGRRRFTQQKDESYSLTRSDRHRGRSPDHNRGRSPDRSDRNYDRSRS